MIMDENAAKFIQSLGNLMHSNNVSNISTVLQNNKLDTEENKQRLLNLFNILKNIIRPNNDRSIDVLNIQSNPTKMPNSNTMTPMIGPRGPRGSQGEKGGKGDSYFDFHIDSETLKYNGSKMILNLDSSMTICSEKCIMNSTQFTNSTHISCMFEWENEKKNFSYGRIVYLTKNNKIKISDELKNNEDAIPVGVCINCKDTGIVMNAFESEWKHKYLLDKYDNYFTQKYYKFKDKNGNRCTSIEKPRGNNVDFQEIFQKKINPEFDPKFNYIPRTRRKEWACVAIKGIIVAKIVETDKINSSWYIKKKFRDLSYVLI
tara:strand:+ start:14212 stop:15162 length:951 start_codon:yes stop_codon:yes gene_type:complete